MPLFTPAPPLQSYRSTYWYSSGNNGLTQALVLGTAYYVPLLIARPNAFDRIGLEVTVAGGSSSHTRLGIYQDSGAGTPGTLILDAGVISSSCTAGTGSITITQSLGPGQFWLAVAAQDGVAPTVRHYSLGYSILGLSSVLPEFAGAYSQTAVTGAFPATATPGIESGICPAVMLRSQ